MSCVLNLKTLMTNQVQFDFSGKHAVITGGAAGIGKACVERLIASGANVTIWDKDEAAMHQLKSALADTRIIAVDVSDEASVTTAVAQTLTHQPRIDILVNSAGITGPNVRVTDYPLEDWNRVFEINTRGTFLTCKHIAAHMLTQKPWAGHHGGQTMSDGCGRIVNIASVAGKEGNPNASAYSASKAAVMALTKSLGKELAHTGIRVNCITPAAVRTALFDQMTDEHIAFMLSKIPMNRFGLVEEIADLVAWLASDNCSFSTGAVFDISGGRATY